MTLKIFISRTKHSLTLARAKKNKGGHAGEERVRLRLRGPAVTWPAGRLGTGLIHPSGGSETMQMQTGKQQSKRVGACMVVEARLAGTGAAMHACARCRLRAWPFDPESLWNSGSLPLAPCRTQHQQWRLRCHAFPIYGLTPRKTGKNGLHKPTKRSSRECEEDCTPRS